MVKLIPLQYRVLLKVEEKKSSEEVVKGGIIIPQDDKESLKYGVVIDISKDIKEPLIKIGDKVLYSEYAGKQVKIDDNEFLLIEYKDIIGKFENLDN
jgi:chaperonin GroES